MTPFTIVIDTREQTPLKFPPEWHTVRDTLNDGDYSIKGMTDLVTIERKSLPDLVKCIGADRERFEREVLRLRGYRHRSVVIEANRKHLVAGGWRGKVTPSQVVGSITSWFVKYQVPFYFCGDAAGAADEVLYQLRKFHDFCVDFGKRIQVT